MTVYPSPETHQSLSELHFESEGLERMVSASEIPSLDEETLQMLHSEAIRLREHLNAVSVEIEEKKQAGIDWDYAWFVRVRTKRNYTQSFIHLVSLELSQKRKLRHKEKCQSERIAKLEAQVERLQSTINGTSEAAKHQKALKKYDLAKRTFFYGYVKELLGEDEFVRLMEKAASAAALTNPGPWVQLAKRRDEGQQ